MVTSRVHFRGMVYASCHGLLWLLQLMSISLQQNEGFQVSSTAPFAIIIHNMLMLLQRVLVLPQQNEGFRGLGRAPVPTVILRVVILE